MRPGVAGFRHGEQLGRRGIGYPRRGLRSLVLRARRRLTGRDYRGELLRDRPLVNELTALLFREDPIGVAAWAPNDEYQGEAEAMTIWLPRAKNLDYVRRQVHEDFAQWLGADIAGEPGRYDSIARAVFAIWQNHKTQAQCGHGRS